MSATFRQIPIEEIYLSGTNPRQKRNVDADRELLESVQRHGVLQPVLVRNRPSTEGTFELVAGSRRFRAAQAADLESIPAMERVLTDVEVLEIQIVENLQRSDVHPLEEAHAYRLLHEVHEFDVARIAERVGRSVPYVYDRMRLTQLIPAAQEQFRDGRFTAAHAILLARLKPEQQKQAIDLDNRGLYEEQELELGLVDDATEADAFKARSARELASWIDSAFRIDVASEELPELFPETAELLAEAQEASIPVLQITWMDRLPEGAKEGDRVLVSSKWKPADGKTNERYGMPSKKCDRAKSGVVVIGPERGKVFDVCADKKCTTHWPVPAQAAEQRKAGAAAKPESPKEIADRAAEQKKREAEEARRAALDAFRKNWDSALPEIRKALAAAIAEAGPATLMGYLSDVVIDECVDNYEFKLTEAKKLISVRKTAEGTIRLAALALLGAYVGNSYRAAEISAELKKGLKIDVSSIIAAKAAKAAAAKPAAKSTAKKKGGRS